MILYDPDIIQQHLQTNRFVREIHVYRSVTSTNTVAKRLADAGAPSGTLVLAEKQTTGKGRMGREWDSPEGVGLWFSLIFRPKSVRIDYRLLPLILSEEIALALRDHSGVRFAVKWPNDIHYSGKKVCGILCESSYVGQKLDYAVAGIGMNVNQGESDFPETLRKTATSLREVLGKKVDRLALLAAILNNFESRFCGENANGNHLTHWRSLCAELGSPITVRFGNQSYSGIFHDISEMGELILRERNGNTHKFLSGEATIVKELK